MAKQFAFLLFPEWYWSPVIYFIFTFQVVIIILVALVLIYSVTGYLWHKSINMILHSLVKPLKITLVAWLILGILFTTYMGLVAAQ